MKQLSIDLNADLGEGFPFDAELMKIVSSANICSGAYIASDEPVREALALAKANDVAVGIHVGYPDVEGFGRRSNYMDPAAFAVALDAQVKSFLVLAEAENVKVSYLKPHGALYHDLNHKSELWNILIEVCVRHGWPVMHLAESDFLSEADTAIKTIHEGFVDRRYASGKELVSRSNPRAVLTDLQEVLAQAQGLLNGGVTLEGGSPQVLSVQSLCLHGDTPGAVNLGLAVRNNLLDNQVLVSAIL